MTSTKEVLHMTKDIANVKDSEDDDIRTGHISKHAHLRKKLSAERERVCVCDRQTNRQMHHKQRFPCECKCQCWEKESIKTRGTHERGKEKRVDSELKRHDLMILLDERGRLKYMIVVPTSACIGDSKDREV